MCFQELYIYNRIQSYYMIVYKNGDRFFTKNYKNGIYRNVECVCKVYPRFKFPELGSRRDVWNIKNPAVGLVVYLPYSNEMAILGEDGWKFVRAYNYHIFNKTKINDKKQIQ